MGASRGPVERRRDGSFRLRLGSGEQELMARLLGELRDLVATASPDDPRLVRLFPPAYLDDDEADAEYQRLMREELVATRLSGLSVVSDGVAGRAMDEAAMYAFMQSLNSLRLVIGTMIDIEEDPDLEEIDDEEPFAAEHHLYGYLSWLLENVVEALAG